MGIIVAVISLFIMFITLSIEKSKFNPGTLFFGMWAIIVFGAYLQMGGLHAGSNKTHIIILVGLVFYFLGYCFSKIFKPQKVNKNIGLNVSLNYKFLYILAFITFIIYAILARGGIELLLQGRDLYHVRYIARGNLSDSTMVYMLRTYIASPTLLLLIPLSAIEFLGNDKRKILLIIVIVFLVLNILSGAGRFAVLYMIINYIGCYILLEKKIYFTKKQKRKAIFIALLGFAVITYMTVGRGSSILRTLNRYTFGCIPHMSYRVEQIGNFPSYTFGITSLHGFIRPLFTLSRIVGLTSELPEIVLLSESMIFQIEEPVYIGGDGIYNAFVTLFHYFYIDLGYIGVAIGTFFYGFLCERVYRNFLYNPTKKNLALYLMIVLSILTSMHRFQFSNLGFALSIIYLYFIFWVSENFSFKKIRRGT